MPQLTEQAPRPARFDALKVDNGYWGVLIAALVVAANAVAIWLAMVEASGHIIHQLPY